MTRFTRGMNGTARYADGVQEPPTYLADLVPAAAKARATWLAENEKGLGLLPAWRASGAALGQARKDHRASRITAAELEAAERTHEANGRALEAQSRKALAALQKFDDLFYGQTLDADKARKAAAAYALTQHAKATAAMADLVAAYTALSESFTVAGHPGPAPAIAPGTDPTKPDGGWRDSSIHIRALLAGYDLDALQAVADGEIVAPAPDPVAVLEARSVRINR